MTVYEKDIRPQDRPVEVTERVRDVYDIVRTEAATVPETATLRDAVEAILAREVTRKAYVVDREGHIKGAITMESLMRHVSYRIGARPGGIVSFLRFMLEMESDAVADFMAPPVTVTLEMSIVDVVRKVVEDHLNDFPIVDEQGRLLGELNTLNLLRAMRGLFQRPADESPG